MRHGCNRYRHGGGLIYAGTIVFVVGLAIILFKELEIPRYWYTAVIGLMLIVAGFAARWLKQTSGKETPENKEV
jgi:ribose/xylose/arabinose/galactoside ABC-type transport system permease subunit